MQRRKIQTMAVFVALLIWLIAGLSGMHSYFCLDGQKTPVAMHIDIIDNHIAHHLDTQHKDVDINASATIASKLFPEDTLLAILFSLVLALLYFNTRPLVFWKTSVQIKSTSGFLPPLRAPPALQ